MSSGVGVSDEVVEQFNNFKLQKAPHNFRYFIYKIEGDEEIVIESTGPKTESYKEFEAKLQQITDECRYGLVDYEFTTDDGRKTSKLVFVSWSPDTAKIKSKMVYASSREALKRVLNGVGITLTATDNSELSDEAVKELVSKYV